MRIKQKPFEFSRFEAMLEDALADRGPCKPFIAEDFHDENDDEGRVAEDSENEDVEEPARTEFVPVISYISPSLACLVSPLSLMRRQEVGTLADQMRQSNIFTSRLSRLVKHQDIRQRQGDHRSSLRGPHHLSQLQDLHQREKLTLSVKKEPPYPGLNR